MSRPRFLADNDLMDQIVLGVQRREPALIMTRLREVGLAPAADSVVLDYAANEGFIVVSHDINTMRAAARASKMALRWPACCWFISAPRSRRRSRT